MRKLLVFDECRSLINAHNIYCILINLIGKPKHGSLLNNFVLDGDHNHTNSPSTHADETRSATCTNSSDEWRHVSVSVATVLSKLLNKID